MGAHAEARAVALITGATRGIGLEIARQLGQQGMTTLIGARDQVRGQAVAADLRSESIDAHSLQLDVTDQQTIDRAADWIAEEYGRLDVLVNNAGVFIDDAPPSTLALEVLRRTYDTNVFGPVAVTKAMLPLLRQCAAGRVVNMSSGLGSLTLTSTPGWEFAHLNLLAYNSSKTALNAVTVQFAKELQDTPIKVNAADPGYTATELNRFSGTRSVQQGAQVAVRLATLPADGPTGGFFDDEGALPW